LWKEIDYEEISEGFSVFKVINPAEEQKDERA
jgi:hypothetical protein